MQQHALRPSHAPQQVTGIFRVIEIGHRRGRKRQAPYRVLTIENEGGAIRAFAHPESGRERDASVMPRSPDRAAS